MFLIQWVLLICAYYMPLVWEIYQEFAPKVLGYLVQVFLKSPRSDRAQMIGISLLDPLEEDLCELKC